jgi:hypothetical protein
MHSGDLAPNNHPENRTAEPVKYQGYSTISSYSFPATPAQGDFTFELQLGEKRQPSI